MKPYSMTMSKPVEHILRPTRYDQRYASVSRVLTDSLPQLGLCPHPRIEPSPISAGLHGQADGQRTKAEKPLECCRNGEKDHGSLEVGVARAEEAEVRRGIIERPD